VISCSLVQFYHTFAGSPATWPWGQNELLQILPNLCQTTQHHCVTGQKIIYSLLAAETAYHPITIHMAFVIEVAVEGQVFFSSRYFRFSLSVPDVHPSSASASTSDTASHYGRQYSSQSPLWERQTSTPATLNTDIHLGRKGNFKFVVWWRVGGLA